MASPSALLTPARLMAGFYAISFFVNGIILPFFPVLLTDKGLSGQEIAFVLATPQIMRMASMPVVSGLSDRSNHRRLVMLVLTAATLALALALGIAGERYAVMLVAALMLVLSYCVAPLADSFAMLLERNGAGDYGRMRLWGSASFILGNVVGGWALDRSGATAIYLLIVLGLAAAMAASWMIPPAPPARAEIEAQALTILRRPAFLAVLLGHAVNQASHAGLYAFATLAWQARGFGDTAIGVLWAVGVIAEIILFACGPWLLPRSIAPMRLMMAGAVIGALRWTLFAADLGIGTAAALQVMHAGSFALAHLGYMRFLRERVPAARAASAQGTFVIFNGLATALATAIAGRLWPDFGAGCFLAMTGFCLAGLAILMLSRRGARRLPALPAGGCPA